MSVSQACNFLGQVPRDARATNVDIGQSLRVNKASICDLESTDAVIQNLTVTNIDIINNPTTAPLIGCGLVGDGVITLLN